MSFDANRILKESSTLVGLRLLPKASQHPKLQDRATVIPLLRQAGSDTKEAMDQLRPVYQEVELLRQTTFTDKNNNDVTNIPGRLYFIIPSDSHCYMLIVCCLRGLCVCVSVSLKYTTPSPILADNTW